MRWHRAADGHAQAVTMTRSEWDHTPRSYKHAESGGGHSVLITDPQAGRFVKVPAAVVPDYSPQADEEDAP